MATPSIHGTARKVFNPETLRSAAKQSSRYLVVPVRLRRAIKKYLRELEDPHLKNKVLRLSQSLSEIKNTNLRLTATTSKALIDDPLGAAQSGRWRVKGSYGDIGLTYRDDETVAYVAARMPAVYSACYRVFKEVRRRLPDFSPSKVLDFGAGTGSAFWALREVWPKSLEKVNLVEPSQSMQRAGQSLIQDLKDLPVIRSYDSMLALSKVINRSGRQHDLVIASYVLGEIPSLKDRITTVRQLWDLTQDILVLIEPGTPTGSNIISQMRSHILWMEKRKLRKLKGRTKEVPARRKLRGRTKEPKKSGAFIVAPCPHDGACPLEKSGTYCHFVQRLERTSIQRVYKRSKGHTIRGFEDEKFSYVAIRRGQRPRESWPLDGMVFETLAEQRASRKLEDPRKLEAPRKLEDPEIDYDNLIKSEQADVTPYEEPDPADNLINSEQADVIPYEEPDPADNLINSEQADVIPYEEPDPVTDDSDFTEADDVDDNDKVEEEEEETTRADLGGGWGRIIFAPVQRGSHIAMNVCRSTKPDASEGEFQRLVVTKTDNPTLHHQARKSFWGDLWPY